MALPPKGDPRRSLALAIRSSLFLGLFLALPTGLMTLASVRVFRRVPSLQLGLLALYLLVFLIPTILYLLTALFLKLRRTWSVILGITAATIHGLFAMLGFVASLFYLPDTVVFTVVCGLWVLALYQLIGHLRKSTVAIRMFHDDPQRGFEVLPVSDSSAHD